MDLFVAEIIGTFLFVLLGYTISIKAQQSLLYAPQAVWIVSSSGWALSVTVAIYAVGAISGAHVNPAITFALCLRQKLPWQHLLIYISAQTIGALIAFFCLYRTLICGSDLSARRALSYFGMTEPLAKKSRLQEILSETVASAVLLWGILSVSESNTMVTPFIIGCIVFAIGLAFGGPTKYTLNPARVIGPQVLLSILPLKDRSYLTSSTMVFSVFPPLMGAAIGVFIYRWVSLHW